MISGGEKITRKEFICKNYCMNIQKTFAIVALIIVCILSVPKVSAAKY